jgi:hypothetical protein
MDKNQVQQLKNILSNYTRDNCPNALYEAWKILILNTSEYDMNKEYILQSAFSYVLSLEY